MRLFFSRIPADHSLGEVALLGVCEVGEESRKGFLFQPQLSAVLKSSETSWEASQPGLQAPRALPTHHGLLTPPPMLTAECLQNSRAPGGLPSTALSSFFPLLETTTSVPDFQSTPDPPFTRDSNQTPHLHPSMLHIEPPVPPPRLAC